MKYGENVLPMSSDYSVTYVRNRTLGTEPPILCALQRRYPYNGTLLKSAIGQTKWRFYGNIYRKHIHYKVAMLDIE